MKLSIPAAFGSGLSLFGAFAVGAVLNEVVVKGTTAASSPFAVGGTLLGLAMIAVGLYLERKFNPSKHVPDDEQEDEDEEAEAEFDEEFSPIDEEMLEGRDRDESYES